jgi:hypothetical protein
LWYYPAPGEPGPASYDNDQSPGHSSRAVPIIKIAFYALMHLERFA